MEKRGGTLASLHGWRFWSGVGLGAAFWVLDAALLSLATGQPFSFRDILAPGHHAVLVRLAVSTLGVALGVQAQLAFQARGLFLRREQEDLARLDAAMAAQAALATEAHGLRARVRGLEQDALRSREHAERILSILDAAGARLSLIGPDFRLRFADPALHRTHGDPAGRTCHDYFMDRPTPCPGCPADEARLAGSCAAAAAVLPREEGRPVQEALVPFTDASGEKLLAQVWTDPALPRSAGEALRRELDLFLAGPAAALTRLGPPDWLVAGASSNISRFGYRPGDLAEGRTAFPSLVHPDDLPRVMAALDTAQGGGRDTLSLAYRILRPDGASRQVLDSSRVERDGAGRIVRLHGLLLEAESPAEPLRASRGFADLPREPPAALPPQSGEILPGQAPAHSLAGPGDLPPLRILLAEDNLPSQEALTYFLHKAGHHVSFAADGREVLAALAREPFDLVLMDVQMPGMDGVETVRRIRKDASGDFDPSIPVIALTAYALEGDREAFLTEGMDDYVSKPINLPTLFAALARQYRPPDASGKPASGLGPCPRFRGDKALFQAAASLVLEEAPSRLAGLRQALLARDLEGARRLARLLAATLDLLPAAEIRPLASRLVHAASAGDLAGASSLLDELAAGQEEYLAVLARSLGAGQREARP